MAAALVATVLVPVGSGVSGEALDVKGRLASAMPAYMAPYTQQHDFSGVVLVAGRNGTTYQGAFGEADATTGRRNSIDNAFAIGSVTKTFTAAAIELLAARNRLKYTDTLDKYVPEYTYAKDVTIDELLNHSAGIPDYYALPAFAAVRARNLSLSAIAKWLSAFPLDFAPGTKGQYSNSGYSLLALVVERVSGEPYQRFLAHNIFGPLHLNHTSSGPYGKAEDVATGYDPGPAPRFIQPAAIIGAGWLIGNGSMRSTATDLSRWLDVAAAGTFVNFKSLPYPDGWSKQRGSSLLAQDGRIPGYAADISIDEQSGTKVVVLSNIQCAAASVIAADMRKAAGGSRLTAPAMRGSYVPGADELSADVGRYALPSLPLVVAKSDGGLSLSNVNDGMVLPLDPVAPKRFFFRPLYAYVSFKTNSAGVVQAINWNDQVTIPRVSQ
jgi:CubicO group peptidase (beta-lactamase class C family)